MSDDGKKTLGLMGGSRSGNVKQSFSHGRTKNVVVETKRKRVVVPMIIHISTGSKEIGPVAGLAVGSVILLEAMFAGPLTNASMNPARSLGPALVSGHVQPLWIYLTAPFLGASLAVVIAKRF